jgi:hypothetical protein
MSELSVPQRSELYSEKMTELCKSAFPIMVRRTPGLVSPQFTGKFHVFTRKEEDLVILGVLHWWMKTPFRVLTRLWLEDYPLQNDYKVLMNLVLKDKYIALIWLSENYHERRFFGNLVPLMEKLLESWSPILESQREPVTVQRKRGYQDHGSLQPLERWTEKHDWSFTELQNFIEAERQTIKDTADFLEGWFS